MIRRTAWIAALAVATGPTWAHPHVFVDGGIDFVFSSDRSLEAVEVTWRFDAFETLYTMSANGIVMGANGTLPAEDLERLSSILAVWPDDFTGSAHLSLDDTPIPLSAPRDFETSLVDGRLQVEFVRDLVLPLRLDGHSLDVKFYEATYFYAFAITDSSTLSGDHAGCATDLVPFQRGAADEDLLDLLWSLDREQTPEIANVGALFADQIKVSCE